MNTIAPSQISLRRILVATDFSDISNHALNYAKAIAKRYASRIVLVHVSQPVARLAIPQGGWVEDATTQRADEEIASLGAELRSEGYATEAISAYGPIGREVLSLAKARAVDLVVLGTHGRRGIDRLLFGSEAEALIRDSDRPVFTAGPAVAAPQNGAWFPHEIICVALPGAGSGKAVAYGYRLAQDTGARFTLFYAEDPDTPPSPGSWDEFEKAFDKALPGGEASRQQIQGYFTNEDPAEDIIEAAKKHRADLIVLSAKHGIPGSTHFRRGVLPDVLLHAPCPVLTIKSSQNLDVSIMNRSEFCGVPSSPLPAGQQR